jgi:tol-pal system protein YbgF
MALKILKLPVFAFVMIGTLSPTLYAQPLEQRVERLERIADNPILLQHSQRIEQQQREIQGLYDQIDHMERQLKVLERRLEEVDLNTESRIDRLEGQVDRLELRPAIVPVDSALEPSLSAVESIDGDMVENIDTPQQPVELVEANQDALDVLDSETPASLSLVDTPSIPESPESSVVEPAETKMSEQEHYNNAFRLLRENKYDESIVAFDQFIEAYPSHSLTSNAYYWLGEAHMIKQDFNSAFDVFNQVLLKFSQTDKYPDAMLRAADALVGLSRLDEAQVLYRQLIAEQPTSRSAKTAERRMVRFN